MIYNIATDIATRQTIWVGTNAAQGKVQSNSHNEQLEYDGLTAIELAGMYAHQYRKEARVRCPISGWTSQQGC